jgi:hypothetical protein
VGTKGKRQPQAPSHETARVRVRTKEDRAELREVAVGGDEPEEVPALDPLENGSSHPNGPGVKKAKKKKK